MSVGKRAVGRGALLFLSGLALGAFAADVLRSQSAERVEAAEAEAAKERAAIAKPTNASVLLRGRAKASERKRDDAEADNSAGSAELEQVERETAERVVTLVNRRIAQLVSVGDADPGVTLNQFLAGTVQTLEAVSPDLLPKLARESAAVMCDPKSRPEVLKVHAGMSMLSEQLANEEGFTCLIERDGPEDVVLWEAMDAWRAHRLPPNEAWDELAERAKDPRTLMRLKALEHPERMAELMREATPAAHSASGTVERRGPTPE